MCEARVCRICGHVGVLEDYPRYTSTIGEIRYRLYCKKCSKKKKDSWRKENKEHHNQKCREWVKNNPEKRKQTVLKYSQKPEYKEYHKKYRVAHRRLNIDKYKARVSARRRRVREATPNWLDKTTLEKFYVGAQALTRERQELYTVDHIVPLNGKNVCGLHVPWNLQILHHKENYSKSNKF